MVELLPISPALKRFPSQLRSMSRVNSFLSSMTGDSPAADCRSVGRGSCQRKKTSQS
jgi:hypothetical protein